MPSVKPKHVVLGAAGIALCIACIKPNEGDRSDAYPDASPMKIWTVCIGETRRPDGTPVRKGDHFTPKECDDMLEKRLREDFIPAVEACAKPPLPVDVEVAFVDTAYNTGTGLFCKSSVVRMWNEGRFADACRRLATFATTAGGKTLKGLVKRRQKASELCLSGLQQK